MNERSGPGLIWLPNDKTSCRVSDDSISVFPHIKPLLPSSSDGELHPPPSSHAHPNSPIKSRELISARGSEMSSDSAAAARRPSMCVRAQCACWRDVKSDKRYVSGQKKERKKSWWWHVSVMKDRNSLRAHTLWSLPTRNSCHHLLTLIQTTTKIKNLLPELVNQVSHKRNQSFLRTHVTCETLNVLKYI